MSQQKVAQMKKIRRGILSAICRMISMGSPSNSGPLICTGMVRNELDIIDTWISHLCSIFDKVIIFDHLSSDGTLERLGELSLIYKNLELRRFTSPSYDQEGLMTKTFEEVSSEVFEGWMFFLDADEFLMVKNRSELRNLLSKYRAATSVCFLWSNAYPVSNTSPISPLVKIEGWLNGAHRVPKVAINLKNANLISGIGRGNHGAGTKKAVLLRSVYMTGARIIHLPIRTQKQIKNKARVGVEANALANNGEFLATHWKLLNNCNGDIDIKIQTYNYGNIIKDSSSIASNIPTPITLSGKLCDFVSFSH